MLTEEIEGTLREHLSINATGFGLDAIQVAQLTVQVLGIPEAAAAIHERLSEGVVWSVEYEVSYDGVCRLWELDKAGERHYAGEINTDELADLDGQLVNVTVKIVEGTKDGNAR